MSNKVLQTVEKRLDLTFGTEEDFNESLNKQEDLNSEISRYFNDPNINVVSMELNIKLVLEGNDESSFLNILEEISNSDG